jgi:hypothetical protein
VNRAAAAAIMALGVVPAGCTYRVTDPGTGRLLATCHDGAYTSFCVIKKDRDDGLVSGSGVVPTANGASGIVTEGAALGAILAR